MARYQAFDPASEMYGMSVQAFTKSILHDDIADILNRHGMDEIDPQKWYSVQKLLDVLNDVVEEGSNTSQVFVSVGIGAAELGYAALPEPVKAQLTLRGFLSAYGKRLGELHHGDVGYVQFEEAAGNHFIMTWRVPYPDDMMYGVFYGYTRLLRPPRQTFSLEYDPNYMTVEAGGDRTVLHIHVGG